VSWWKDLIIEVRAAVIGVLVLALALPCRRWLVSLFRRQALNRRIEDAGITNFYTSRDDYALYRRAPKLVDFLSLANRDIHICAHWMAHGTEIEGIADEIAQLTKPPKKLRIYDCYYES